MCNRSPEFWRSVLCRDGLRHVGSRRSGGARVAVGLKIPISLHSRVRSSIMFA
jgi:hypothetical protein